MTVETVTVDPELARQALGEVLDKDAAAQPAAQPPPRRIPPPDATPEAPWGFKADGTPRKGPAGPGRPRKDTADAPRTAELDTSTPGGSPDNSQPSEPRSYAQEVNDALAVGWMILATIPPTKPQAYILHEAMPNLVPAWDQAAQHNASVRKFVLKISGDGSWAWVVPVAISTIPVLMGFWQVLGLPKEDRAKLVAASDQHLKEFVLEQAKSAGLEIPAESGSPAGPGAESPARAA